MDWLGAFRKDTAGFTLQNIFGGWTNIFHVKNHRFANNARNKIFLSFVGVKNTYLFPD